jgi:UDP-N-acetylmuramoyl-L-alanine---L-glutamate ligase
MTWDIEDFTDKDVVFVGVGKGRAYEGFKAFLDKHGRQRSLNGVDRQNTANPLGFLKDYDPAQTVFVKNEAIPGHEMPVSYVTPMQLFFKLVGQTGAQTVGITGTKGKSTTAALTAHILKTAGKDVILAGNIGLSPLESLDSADANTIYVLELSSYQLDDLKASPHISACINLYNDHTDWHGSLEAYWAAKHNIILHAAADDLFIYNSDFPTLNHWAKEATCRTKAINPSEKLGLLEHSRLFGEHNRLNALVTLEIARECGVDDNISEQAINSFEPLRHRMQYVSTKNNRVYIDDAIGMTPESTLASLAAITTKYGNIGCLLLGGQDRDYNFTNLMLKVAAYNIPNLVLFPNTIEKMRFALPEGYTPNIHESENMDDAVAFASQNSPDKSVILLSTAAPSYLLWRDFEDKGDQFQTAVNNLQA